jgi:hypothetical protein
MKKTCGLACRDGRRSESKYSVEPPTAAEAAQTVHINIVMTVVLWVVAVVVLVCGPRNLSRHPRQVLATASGESQPRVR